MTITKHKEITNTRDLLSDAEVQLYIKEIEKLRAEISKLNKSKRNNEPSDLDRKCASKSMLEDKIEYYNIVLQLASIEQINEANIARHKDKVMTQHKKVNVPKAQGGFSRFLEKYYKKRVEEMSQCLY